MTDEEKVAMVKAMTDETDGEVVSAFLSLAGESIYRYADPYGVNEKETILERYGGVQVRAAAYLLNKRGAEGQSSHSENGISRGYESGDLPVSLLKEITPYCSGVR